MGPEGVYGLGGGRRIVAVLRTLPLRLRLVLYPPLVVVDGQHHVRRQSIACYAEEGERVEGGVDLLVRAEEDELASPLGLTRRGAGIGVRVRARRGGLGSGSGSALG